MVKLVQPISCDEVESAQPTAHRASTPRADSTTERPLKILAIDDDADILENLADSLNAAIYDVKTTESFEQFHDRLRDFDPDIIVSDLAMPAHDGVDILHTLRDQGYTGEIVLMSGKDGHVLDSVRRVATSYGLNVTGVLRKPFTPQQLLAIVARSAGGERATEDARILRALSDRKIRPYFQPKIDLKTGRIVGAEALSRWHHPHRGLLGPQAYLKSKRSAKNTIHDFTILE